MRWPLSRLSVAVLINVLVLLLLTAAGILLRANAHAPTVEAFFLEPRDAEARIITRIISPAVTPAAPFRDNRVRITGMIQCTPGQTLLLRVTVTQGATEATGEATYACAGHPQRWVVDAVTRDGAELVRGGADVHVWASTLEDGDVREWESAVRLAGPQ